ncbi:MAG: hypothetical protein WCS37_06275 [Chloroflexota bacterium]|nr:hypothetical protein [Chloroflexota bacterium]
MARTGDYNLCITAGDDRYVVKPEDLTRLIDFLDAKMYLDGPDRDNSRLVVFSYTEAKTWEPFLRANTEAQPPYLRRRHVNILHSPAAPEERFKNYGELILKLDNLIPKDAPFVASLGYTSRKLSEIIYCPVPGQSQRWINTMTIHLMQGYHPIWRRVWVEENERKEWQLQAVKAFILMVSCKLNPRVNHLTIEEFVETLRLKIEFVYLLSAIGDLIGTKDFELLGGSTE